MMSLEKKIILTSGFLVLCTVVMILLLVLQKNDPDVPTIQNISELEQTNVTNEIKCIPLEDVMDLPKSERRKLLNGSMICARSWNEVE